STSKCCNHLGEKAPRGPQRFQSGGRDDFPQPYLLDQLRRLPRTPADRGGAVNFFTEEARRPTNPLDDGKNPESGQLCHDSAKSQRLPSCVPGFGGL
ncbi:unnamed protein product, partial [Tetraodon nigroviridis]